MKYRIINKERLFQGYFAIDRYTFEHEKFEGGNSAEVVREVFERGNAAAVLPYDSKSDSVVLVEQFRIGALNSDVGPWQLETIAGVIDKDNESIEELVKREAIEEANCYLDEVIPIMEYYCSPGGATEKISLFAAEVDATDIGGVYGLDEESEDIKVHVIKREKALGMIKSGEIQTAMTIIALQWLELNLNIFK
ncbi:MAG: ADP-ribose diphosphatase [Gammaproteobacteria bacterium]|nr:MAG: ADP-ribose diphosphatase [Gammaproteobacteria bacterium]